MRLDDDIAILAAAPVFAHFERDALRLLSFAGERFTLQPGDTLFRYGDTADGGYVVLSGTVALTPGSKTSKGEAEPILAGPSTLIGRTTLFSPGKRPAEAEAATRAEVIRISRQLMGRMLREFPEAASAIRGWLSEDLADLVRDLNRVRGRLVDDPS